MRAARIVTIIYNVAWRESGAFIECSHTNAPREHKMKQQRYLSVLTAALLALGTVSAYAAAGGNGGETVVVAVAEVTVQAAWAAMQAACPPAT